MPWKYPRFVFNQNFPLFHFVRSTHQLKHKQLGFFCNQLVLCVSNLFWRFSSVEICLSSLDFYVSKFVSQKARLQSQGSELWRNQTKRKGPDGVKTLSRCSGICHYLSGVIFSKRSDAYRTQKPISPDRFCLTEQFSQCFTNPTVYEFFFNFFFFLTTQLSNAVCVC